MSSTEVSCTCYPSPPGATIRCEGGQIAVCGTAGTTTCQGKCVTVDPSLALFDYAAKLLSEVIGDTFTATDLEADADECARVINKLLQSSNQNKPVRFMLANQSYYVSVGLTEVAIQKLGETVVSLANVRRPAVAKY